MELHRHCKMLRIENCMLEPLLTGRSKLNIPDDATIVNLWFEIKDDCYYVLINHLSFDPNPLGCSYPIGLAEYELLGNNVQTPST